MSDVLITPVPAFPATEPARPVRLSVLGTGYLGATHAVCMAELGHEVARRGRRRREDRVAGAGRVPFFEPGLEPLLRKHLATGRLRFTTDMAEAARYADVHFVCVGTPQRHGATPRTCVRRRGGRRAGRAPDRPPRWSSASRRCRSAPRRG